jgi:serine/threonine-protein kinase
MKKRKNRWRLNKRWIYAILLGLCALVLFYFALDKVILPLYTRQGREFEVPNFMQLSLADAESLAAVNRLVLVVEDEKFSPGIPKGTILEQLPNAGSLCKIGRRVRVIPAAAQPVITMPNLIGLDGRDAQWRCVSLDLVCPREFIFHVFSDTTPLEKILAQFPPPDSLVAKNDTITLTISMGPQPAAFTVPELVGQTLHEARKRIREAGLVLGMVTQKAIPNLDAGTVIAQSISSGTEVPSGTSINLVVSILEKEY